MTTQEQHYLTAGDVTRLLRIDKSTVYRMAEDGRLHGVKVGRQWRFPAEELERAFGVDVSAPEHAEALTSLYAELFGVMAIVTDLDGRPLTPVANPSDYFEAISANPTAVEACTAEWRSHASDRDLQPSLRPSRFGFLCARAYIRSGFELVGMVIAGGIAPDDWPPSQEQLEQISAATGVAADDLRAKAERLPRLDEPATKAMLDGLSALANHLSPDHQTPRSST